MTMPKGASLRVDVKPALLRWARDRAGPSIGAPLAPVIIFRDISYQSFQTTDFRKSCTQLCAGTRAFLVGAGLKPAPRAPRGQPALAARIARVSVRTGCVLSAAAFMSDTHYTLDV